MRYSWKLGSRYGAATALVLAVLLISACTSGQTANSGKAASSGTTPYVTNSATVGTQAPAVNVTATADNAATVTAGAECAGSALRVSLGPTSGASGHIAVILQFTNISAHACYLRGYPTAVELRGSEPSVSAAKTLTGYLGFAPQTQSPPQKVQLAPGQTARALLEWADVDVKDGGLYDAAHCPDYGASGLLVTAPGASYAEQVLTTHLGICLGFQVHPVTVEAPGM